MINTSKGVGYCNVFAYSRELVTLSQYQDVQPSGIWYSAFVRVLQNLI